MARDDKPKSQARQATVTSRAERDYAKQLKLLARQVGNLVESYESGLHGLPTLTQLLRGYAEGLVPWARRIAARMLGEVDARDRAAWSALGNAISAQLHQDIRNAPVGERMRELLGLQVSLIQSIPTEAAQRVHELATKARIEGTRAKEIAEEIARTGEVTASRAMLIARTEVSRAATTLVQARAEAIASTHFIWRTSLDGSVREDHRKLEGKTFAWDDPPVADSRTGEHALPGAIYNCRCYAEPVISDPYKPQRQGRRR